MQMTVRKMQLIDKYAGSIACSLLSIADTAIRLLRGGKKADGQVRTIALVKFWGMGTIIVASPAMRKLRVRHPAAKIVFLTFENNTDICNMLSVADQVVSIGIRNGFFRFLRDTLAALRLLRRMRIDVLFDLEFFTRFSAIVSYLSGARERIGFHSWDIWRGNLHTKNVSFNRYWHMSDNFGNLLGVKDADGAAVSGLSIPPAAFEKVMRLRKEHAVPEGKYLCVNVNAAVEFGWERRWEGKRFAALADRLIEEYGVHAVFIGSRAEREYVENVIGNGRLRERMHNFSGLTDSAGLAALLKESRLLISNDTGPLHLAAIMAVPTVSFFGSDTPVLYGPRGEQHLVFYRNIDCSPCVSVMVSKEIKCHKGYPQCLAEITVDDVFAAIKKKEMLSK